MRKLKQLLRSLLAPIVHKTTIYQTNITPKQETAFKQVEQDMEKAFESMDKFWKENGPNE